MAWVSAFGTRRTSRCAQPMFAFGGKADIAGPAADARRSAPVSRHATFELGLPWSDCRVAVLHKGSKGDEVEAQSHLDRHSPVTRWGIAAIRQSCPSCCGNRSRKGELKARRIAVNVAKPAGATEAARMKERRERATLCHARAGSF